MFINCYRHKIIILSALPKLIYKYKAMPIKILTKFYVEIKKPVLKFTWKCRVSTIAKTTWKTLKN